MPPNFETWPLDDRADFLAWKLRREGVIKAFRRELDIQDRDSGRLSSKEIARALAVLYHGRD